MDTTFKQAADPFEGLRQAIEEHAVRHPDSEIRDVYAALKYMNAVFVAQGAIRDQSFGTDISDAPYHVGVSCGDGRYTFFIETGYNEKRALEIARHLCWYNPDMKVLSEKPPHQFIAVNPHRISDVFDHRGNMIFGIKDSQYSCSMVYGDDHRASIDSFLLENKLLQARYGHQRLERPAPVASVDGKVVALPFKRQRTATPT